MTCSPNIRTIVLSQTFFLGADSTILRQDVFGEVMCWEFDPAGREIQGIIKRIIFSSDNDRHSCRICPKGVS